MRVTKTPIQAWAHCPRFAAPGIPCDGVEQEQVAGVRETIAFTYSDSWGGRGASDPTDQVLANITERTIVTTRWPEGVEDRCPHCGEGPREIADQVRPVYDRLTSVPPDQLLRIQRDTTQAQQTQASAAERSAGALEEANRLELRRLDEQAESNRLKRIELGIEPAPNGHGEAEQRPSDTAPRRKRSTP